MKIIQLDIQGFRSLKNVSWRLTTVHFSFDLV